MTLLRNRLLIALPIVAMVATACGGTTTSSAPASAAGGSAAPPASASTAPAGSPAASTAAKDFSGVTVNVITFTGPPIAEPLQRHALEWEKATGGKINVTTAPFSDLFQKEATDLSTGTNAFTLYTMSSSWLGSFAGEGYFQDLTSVVPTYPGLQWDDVVPVMQSNSSFGGKIYAVPIDSDVLSVYYRTDILGKAGTAPPKTWDEYLAVAKKYNGQDLNGD